MNVIFKGNHEKQDLIPENYKYDPNYDLMDEDEKPYACFSKEDLDTRCWVCGDLGVDKSKCIDLNNVVLSLVNDNAA
jgi:hypothetical protein